MLAFPIAGLLAQFQVLAPQPGDFGTQFGHFLPQLRNHRCQIDGAIHGRRILDQHVFHDTPVLPELPQSKKGQFPSRTASAKLYPDNYASYCEEIVYDMSGISDPRILCRGVWRGGAMQTICGRNMGWTSELRGV